MVKLGLPEEDIMAYAQKFMDIADETKFIAALVEYRARAQEALDAAKEAHDANPAPEASASGTDNRLK
jgi:hypothetical protein